MPCFVLGNDPGTSLHLFIIFNVYWECLVIESISEIYVNSKLRTKCYKTKKKHSNIYQSTNIQSTKTFFHSISVKDLFPLQIFIDTLFILMYSMIRCFYYFLVDHNNNIRCTMILHIFLLFNCKYYFHYFDHVCVPSDYIQLKIMMTKWYFSFLIN